VSPDEIIDWQILEDHTIVNLLNLSQLSFLAFPILGVIVPLVIWIAKKDKIKDVDKVGKAILNFQITWTIAVFITYLLWFANLILRFGIRLPAMGLLVLIIVLYVFNLLMIIINSVRSYRLKKTFYKPAFSILR
jgi:uncharacterized Tic20 family protein